MLDRSQALLTDLYQLTMACAYWSAGRAEREACFTLSFRRAPFGSGPHGTPGARSRGGYAIAAGLGEALEWLSAFRFTPDDLAWLATLVGADGKPLFAPGFLAYLERLRLTVDVDAVPEGTVVFAHEPLVSVRGPLLQGQLLETGLLNLINFPTLIATKAARICRAARGASVLEFGLRRAQGVDGALTASRAAYLGGCAATSNVLAGRIHGIPVRGTHAHSWVVSFDDEREAFDAYARAMPGNVTFLVDTYDTSSGVDHAIEAGRALRARGHELLGIRLDSGDLAALSIEAREKLDAAGFRTTRIVASNDLDERAIARLLEQGARIDEWGVGTRLATGAPDAALGGVYKLTALRSDDGSWSPRMKFSDDPGKATLPGVLGVRRFVEGGRAQGDVLYAADGELAAEARCVEIGAVGAAGPRALPRGNATELLAPVLRSGTRVGRADTLADARERARAGLELFDAAVLRNEDPEPYFVGLEAGLHALRTRPHLERRNAR